MRIFVKDGQLVTIWNDQLIPFIDGLNARFGTQEQLQRASHIEENPDRTKNPGRFLVDLTPSGGPILFEDEQGRPFNRREDALAFEMRWLESQLEADCHAGSFA